MLSGRDRALIGAFVLVNVVVVLVVLMVGGSGEEADRSKAPKAGKAAPRTDRPSGPRAGRLLVSRTIGARIRKPRKWKAKRSRRAISLRSPDSTTFVSISRPPGATRSARVLRAAVRAIRRRYGRVRVRRRRLGGRVSGLPTASTVLAATNRKGTRLTILVSAPRGRARAWLVQVFSGPGSRGKRLPEARAALGTLLLRG